MPDVFVHFMKLPVHGCVTPNDDGSFSIFLNANDSFEEQKKTYLHEVRHITRNDFEKFDVETIERETNESC